MPVKILMPALSPTMKEGNLAKWAKVKLVGLGLIIFTDGDNDIGAFPFAGLNFTF